ncbi:MAG: NUDIX domain-containing protein [Proteobacteria bacterium]|nr:NUDIX domain-containing protein [Pseudomonadota bacterium]
MSLRPVLPLPSRDDVLVETERRVWDGRFPLDVIGFRQRRFDGGLSGVRTWELWRRGRAAAVLPYDPDRDQVLLIEQFRLPALAAGLDPVLVELPAGLCEDGESPEITIMREAGEEAGVVPDRLHRIADVLLSPGGSDELCTVFAGRVRLPPAGPDGVLGHGGLASEEEDIRLRAWPATAAIAAAVAGRFPNALTMLALLWLAAERDRLRADWSET